MSEDFHFDDGGDAYVKGEKDVPIDWASTARLQDEIERIKAIDDENERLREATVLIARMYGERSAVINYGPNLAS